MSNFQVSILGILLLIIIVPTIFITLTSLDVMLTKRVQILAIILTFVVFVIGIIMVLVNNLLHPGTSEGVSLWPLFSITLPLAIISGYFLYTNKNHQKK
jgi:uncharacterized membrane protein